MERGIHARGGLPIDARIDRSEHTPEDWEVLTEALVGALARRGLMNVDELRRGIESMSPNEYERASYYERWLFSMEETILAEKRVLAGAVADALQGMGHDAGLADRLQIAQHRPGGISEQGGVGTPSARRPPAQSPAVGSQLEQRPPRDAG